MTSLDPLQTFSSLQDLDPTLSPKSKKTSNSKHVEIMWKWIATIIGVFFILCALVQYNDPDFLIWMLVYIIPCFLSWTIAFQMHFNQLPQATEKSNRRCGRFIGNFFRHMDKIIVCHMMYCIGLGILTWRNLFMVQNKSANLLSSGTMKDEEVKELLGLCIVLAWLSLLKNYNFLRLGKVGFFIGCTLTLLPILSWMCLDVIESFQAPC